MLCGGFLCKAVARDLGSAGQGGSPRRRSRQKVGDGVLGSGSFIRVLSTHNRLVRSREARPCVPRSWGLRRVRSWPCLPGAPRLEGAPGRRAASALMETAGALFTGRGRDPSSEPTEEPVSWATTLLSARNYGPTVLVQQEAKKRGCEQVLWLYGPDHQLTEVGTMNIFIYWTHEDGVLELVTPSLDGVILPGVVRQSLLDLARTWGEFRVAERKITMKELLRALEEGRVREVFGSGTACQVCPVHQILYQGKHLHIPTMENGPELILRFLKELKAIQYGAGAHEWMLPV